MASPSKSSVTITNDPTVIDAVLTAIDALLTPPTIFNSREDLDAIKETFPERHAEFMAALKGSMTRKQDVQQYPKGHGQPGYEGPTLEPIWEDVEDLSTIQRFGFSKSDFTGG